MTLKRLRERSTSDYPDRNSVQISKCESDDGTNRFQNFLVEDKKASFSINKARILNENHECLNFPGQC